ncbi:MAG: hypothetical protein ACREKN_04700 [Longimicrobiaceae bacterium]
MTVPPDRTTAVYGWLSALLVLAALVVAIRALIPAEVDPGAVETPEITLLGPLDGETVQGPVGIVFSVKGRLFRQREGWGIGPLHLHLLVGRRAYMPGFEDVQPLGDGRYRWEVSLPAGRHTLRLAWATGDHGTLPRGGSSPVAVRVRDTLDDLRKPGQYPSPAVDRSHADVRHP